MKRQKGFTLVEVMMTVFLAVTTVAAVGASLGSGAWMATDNRSRLYAISALREEMEVIRNTSYDTVVGWGASSSFTNAQLTKLQNGSGTIAVGSSFGNDIKKITLSVAWSTRNGATRTQSMTTYFCRKGLNGA